MQLLVLMQLWMFVVVDCLSGIVVVTVVVVVEVVVVEVVVVGLSVTKLTGCPANP